MRHRTIDDPLTLRTHTQPKGRMNRAAFMGSLLLLLLVIGAIGLSTLPSSQTPVTSLTISDFPSQGQAHIAEGEAHPPYNSNPPTSGWHYTVPAAWGVYRQAIPDETVVHNLEHGGIWLSYQDAHDEQTIQALEAIVKGFPDHMLLTWRPANEQPIAVAAWGHVLKLETLNKAAILDFITRYYRQGPEAV